MPLYIGVPVTIEEAYRLFDVNIDETIDIICSKRKIEDSRYAWYHLSDYLATIESA